MKQIFKKALHQEGVSNSPLPGGRRGDKNLGRVLPEDAVVKSLLSVFLTCKIHFISNLKMFTW